MSTRHYIEEKYFVLTNLHPMEAFQKHGFWLDPAETRFIDGVKHYRVIYPRQVKGGWASSYTEGPCEQVPPKARINSIADGEKSDPETAERETDVSNENE